MVAPDIVAIASDIPMVASDILMVASDILMVASQCGSDKTDRLTFKSTGDAINRVSTIPKL
ncbi:hypothetical protein AMR41_19120 [Hapalosiphon sp. MRB220]|nr:hypothetical protein AMR41_19120 [Hapalosiphon sp. MRB220]